MNYNHHYKLRDFQFAQQLVNLRNRAGLTQEKIALKIGVTEKAIRNWEGGCNYPTNVHMRHLIEIYLYKNVFEAGREQDEIRELWKQLQERAQHRTIFFDEQWFTTLLTRWRADYNNNGSLQHKHIQAHQSEQSQPTQSSSRLLRGDWSEVLDMSCWYGRKDELAELESWLLKDRCRLVALLGMRGIGKTVLAARLVQQVRSHFQHVLWCSLNTAPALEEVLLDWLQILSGRERTSLPQQLDQQFALLVTFLQMQRSLVVFDGVENVLEGGVLEGCYRQGYEGYATLLHSMAETKHQSCLVLTCSEQIPQLGAFTGQQSPVHILRLSGMALSASRQLLQDKGIFGQEEAWSELVHRYAGNPLVLRIVAETVRELFAGNIAAFLADGFMISHSIRRLLKQQFERLSALEQEVLYWLTITREPATLEAFRSVLSHPTTGYEIIEALHILHCRGLVERAEQMMAFTLQPVVLEYVTEQVVSLVSEEICTSRPVLLLTHILLQGRAKDYLHNGQVRLIVQPVLDRLVSRFGSHARLEVLLESLLHQLRTRLPEREAQWECMDLKGGRAG